MYKFLISTYKCYISPLLSGGCKMDPPCVEYGKMAFLKYGLFKGGFMVIKRILKCNKRSKTYYDPLI